MSINANEIEAARSNIAAIARRMLAGTLSYIEGSHAILGLLHAARVDHADDDFTAFAGIDSESHHFPIGADRDLWNAEGLAKLQPEIERVEQWARSFGADACMKVIDRFEGRTFEGI